MTKRNKGLDLVTVLTIEADHPHRFFQEQRLAFVNSRATFQRGSRQPGTAACSRFL